MTQKVLFLIVLLGFMFQALATEICEAMPSQEVSNALRLSGFNCETKKSTGCEYQECFGKISGYSKPVLILLPANLSSFRVHFH